jgi:hypothetical protein
MTQASRIGSLGEGVRRWGAAAGVALGLVACGPQDLNGAHALGGGTDASVTARRVDLAPPAAPATAAETDQKASIHAAYLSARMKEAAGDARYAITPSKLAPLVARSWSKGFEGRFDDRGVALSAEGQDWQGRMDVVRFGCGETLEAVTGGAAPVRDGKDANRLSYLRHAGRETFTETWVNGDPGIEQGFTVARSPCAESAREFTIEVAVDGLTPGMRDGKTEGGAVELRGEDGLVRLRYADLYAYDAAGVVLPARMVVEGGRVALRVSVDGARWPVVVDPVVATQEAKLQQEIGAAKDTFGADVSVSGDTALVGALSHDVGANVDQGSAYVFVRSGTGWTQQAHLTASDGAASDLFGSSVSVAGDTALVGAGGDTVGTNATQGSAYVFVRNGVGWAQQAHLTANDGLATDHFGWSVSVSGDTALVGAQSDDVGANLAQGSAYVYVRSGATWGQQAHLTASDGAASDSFGSVSVSGDAALVGAIGDDVGANVDQGSAYVYVRSGTTWAQQAHLTASDGAGADYFGGSVSVSGDTALVGAYYDTVGANLNQGSAYVYVRSGATWGQQAHLTANDGAVNDGFGWSVSVSGDTAFAGAWLDDVGANVDQGSAYVYVRSGTTWGQQAHLTASDGAVNDYFGVSVSVSGDTALVGAQGDTIGPNLNQGSAYVYVRSGTTWGQQAHLAASDGATSDFFGFAVSVSGDTALVGAESDDVGANANQGSAYVFVRNGMGWTEQAHLTASDGAANDYFGWSASALARIDPGLLAKIDPPGVTAASS